MASPDNHENPLRVAVPPGVVTVTFPLLPPDTFAIIWVEELTV